VDGGSSAILLGNRDKRAATFACPDLTTFAGVDVLGLVVTGQRLEPDCAVLACRVRDPDDCCHRGSPALRVIALRSVGLVTPPSGRRGKA